MGILKNNLIYGEATKVLQYLIDLKKKMVTFQNWIFGWFFEQFNLFIYLFCQSHQGTRVFENSVYISELGIWLIFLTGWNRSNSIDTRSGLVQFPCNVHAKRTDVRKDRPRQENAGTGTRRRGRWPKKRWWCTEHDSFSMQKTSRSYGDGGEGGGSFRLAILPSIPPNLQAQSSPAASWFWQNRASISTEVCRRWETKPLFSFSRVWYRISVFSLFCRKILWKMNTCLWQISWDFCW